MFVVPASSPSSPSSPVSRDHLMIRFDSIRFGVNVPLGGRGQADGCSVVYCVCTVILLPSVSSARASNVMLSWLWECSDSGGGGGGGGGNSHHERKRQERASEREETRDCLSIVSRCGGERVGSASLTWAAAGCSCIARWCSGTCPCPAADQPTDRACVLQPASQAPSMARHSNVSASTGLLDLDL